MSIVKRANPDRNAMAGRFGKFDGEKEQPVREQKVTSNPLIEKLKVVWGLTQSRPFESKYEIYSRMDESLKRKGICPTPDDVGAFCIAMKEFEETKPFQVTSGLFISALINNGPAGSYCISLDHIPERVYYLGTNHAPGRDVAIIGGDICDIGWRMEGGSIIRQGDTIGAIGPGMKGGSITINGGLRGSVGKGMAGGLLIINGSLTLETYARASVDPNSYDYNVQTWEETDSIGEKMSGGEIRLNDVSPSLMAGIRHRTKTGGKVFQHGVEVA
ncbi:MAG: hypothetical protein V1827_01145 [Candidatus Micrarchaeota archaeon]